MIELRKQYWPFFWPLALTGFAMILADQFKNGVLGRYPEALSEIAIFAIAASIFQFCNAGMIFVPQMTNVLARCPASARICLRFVLIAAFCLSLPVLLCGFTPLGTYLIPKMFNVRGEWLDRVTMYLMLLSPMVLINAMRQYFTGLLIQSRLTGWVTILNMIMLTVTILILLLGLSLSINPIFVISAAFVIPALVHLSLTFLVYLRNYEQPIHIEDGQTLTYARTFKYFYPAAVSSAMFALSRPVIYGFVSYSHNPVLTIAIMRIVFDFTMIFYNVLNQFRNLFVTFGKQDRVGVRDFMLKVFVVVFGSMLIVCISPIHAWCLYYLLGIEDMAHIQMAQEAMLVLCIIPIFITIRNYYHGVAMVEHKTGRMGTSGIMRIIAITAVVAVTQAYGCLDHIAAAFALVAGFIAEAISMWWLSRDRRTVLPVPPALCATKSA